MVYCLVTLHIWGRIFKMFPELRGLTYTDDATIIGRFSQALKLVAVSKSVFKSDGNLDFNMGKTEFLAKGPTARHVFEQAQYFFRLTPTYRASRMTLLQRCSKRWDLKCLELL
jgi:hypothetical protein